MKKLLALLFVCAGLTAMAATPHVNLNAPVHNGKPVKSMVMKSNTLANQLSAPVMQQNKNAMSVQKFFAEKKVTPADNKLMKKAPRRVGDAEVMATKIAFMEQYEYDETAGDVVESNIFYYGGWDVDLEKLDENQFGAYLFFTGIPFVFNVDYEAGTAEMVMESLAGFQWSDTTVSGRTTTIYDTTEYIALFDEAFMMNDDPDAEPANLQGTLYADGTIYIPDGWTIYDVQYTVKTVIRSGQTTTTYDTVAGLLCGFMRDTYLMAPTATHTYVDTYDNSEGENNVYMYQYDDTTAVVWNMFGLGNRGNYCYLREGGVVEFPNIQYGGDMYSMREYCETNYAGYDWTDADHVTFMAYDESTGKPSGSVEFINGTWTPEQITLPYISWSWWGYDNSQSGWVYLYFPPYADNVLKFTDGEKFLFGDVQLPDIVVTEGEEAYTFTGVSEEGATVYLGIYDPETSQITALVDNPYVVNRTEEDQTIYLAAYADGYDIGKIDSGWIGFEPFVVPALEGSGILLGDVNNDGAVNPTDATVLINALLSENFSNINMDNADMDANGTINVTDAILLINYLLTL